MTDKPTLQGELEQTLVKFADNKLTFGETAEAILATVSKHLPEKVKDRTGETPEGKTYHTKNGYWVTAEDYGRNTAITEMEKKLGGDK